MNPERLLQNFDRLIDTPDAVPRLRRFILDLAVRGKLVEQDPEDEPAGELLKRIEGEKKRLVKAGTIKEQKPLTPIDIATTPFDPPSGWKWTRLGATVNNHFGGGTPSKSNFAYWDGDIFWASVKDIGKTKYVVQTIDRISEDGLKNSSSNLIPPGNLIVVTRMGLGKVSINQVPMAINQDLRALILSSFASIDFYYIFFKTASYEGSGLTVKGIKVEELLNFPFPLPPLAEQHRIVAKVDELMKLCDELEAAQAKRERRRDRLVAATLHGMNGVNLSFPLVGNPSEERLRTSRSDISFEDSARFYFNHLPGLTTRTEHIQQLRQTILNLAVRGRLVEQNPEDEPIAKSIKKFADQKPSQKEINANDEVSNLGESYFVPNGWAWLKGYQIADFIDPQPSHRTPPVFPSGVAYIGYSDITSSGQIDFINARKVAPSVFVEHRQRYTLKKGDFIIGKIGTIGQPVLLTEPFDYTLSANIILVQPHAHLVEPSYLMTFISSPVAERVLRKVKTDSTHAVFGIKKARELLIPVPPFAEQHRIVAKVDELMALCDEMESRITTNTTTSRKLLEATLQETFVGCTQTA